MNKRLYILNNKKVYEEFETDENKRLCDIFAEKGIKNIICADMDGSIVSLADTPKMNSKIAFLSPYNNQLASRVFLRGATFLLYCASKALFPGKELIVDHSLYGSVFCRIDGISDKDIDALEKKIYSYIREDKDFIFTRMHVNEAKKILTEEGLNKKAELLSYRPFDHYNLYEFDGRKNYFHGIMPKSAGYLNGLHLYRYFNGFVLKYPTPFTEASTPITEQPKYENLFTQAERWGQILSVSYIADINGMLKKGGIEDFIAINEALHEKTIAEFAQKITEKENARIVQIAGPSSSGKTTFAGRLSVHLKAAGKKCTPISLDDYYKNREDIPLDSNGELDLECLEALDLDKLNDDLLKLLSGKTANLPRYDFCIGKRKEETVPLKLDDDLLVIEGIHGLDDRLTEGISNDKKFKIYVSPLTALNFDEQNVVFPDDLRLLRRLVRDKRTRGYSFAQTFAVWDSVRRGEFKYILPYQETADLMFNSTLLYEILVLKKHCYDELKSFTPHMPYYTEANSLLKFLNYFLSFENEKVIPINSIMREFIGPITI